jgi:predicted nucleic acid-binding protein
MGALASLTRMHGQRVYIDANYFIYFLARHDTYFEAAAAVMRACDTGEIIGMTGDAVIAELLVKPYRDNDTVAITGIKQLFARQHFIECLHHDFASFDHAAEIRGKQGGKLIDALHYATALKSGCRFFLSNDHRFKSTEHMEAVAISQFIEQKT